jgi:[protein-PII] uridylyltransferase
MRGICAEEVAAHFREMPEHYWEAVTGEDLIWGLETVHAFLELVASLELPGTKPIIATRIGHAPGEVRVMLCTWNRQGLLAKAAAAFSEARLAIRSAEAHTRGDSIVLDTFTITGVGGARVTDTNLKQVCFLLEGALSDPPLFASVWMCARHKLCTARATLAPRIFIRNDLGERATVIQVEAADRLGLLYDILESISNNDLDVVQARIRTNDGIARDSFQVREPTGATVLSPDRLKRLQASLEENLR